MVVVSRKLSPMPITQLIYEIGSRRAFRDLLSVPVLEFTHIAMVAWMFERLSRWAAALKNTIEQSALPAQSKPKSDRERLAVCGEKSWPFNGWENSKTPRVFGCADRRSLRRQTASVVC